MSFVQLNSLSLYWSRSQKCYSSAPLILKFATGLLNTICTHWHFMHWQFTSHTRIVFTINQQVSHSKWISSPLYRWDSSQTQTHCSVLFNAETACCCLLDSVETGQIVSIVLLHTEMKDFPCFHCHICVCGTFNSHVGFTWLLFSFCLENNCMCVCKCVITQMVVELRNAKAANREIGVKERESENVFRSAPYSEWVTWPPGCLGNCGSELQVVWLRDAVL